MLPAVLRMLASVSSSRTSIDEDLAMHFSGGSKGTSKNFIRRAFVMISGPS
jgi:hypothetical protein